jgi:thiamine biosynthesis lipoprotein
MTLSSPTDIHVAGTPPPRLQPVRHVEKCMGTMFSFHIATPGVTRTDLLLTLAWLHDMDALFSTYRAGSQINRINSGTLTVAGADDEVRDVLAACERYRDTTDGYFDHHTPDGQLDPSGYVKGWAIQTASDMLAAAGSVNHCVNGGGDVACTGRPVPDRPWRIGVSDPHRPGVTVRTVAADGPIAVATSGLAERGAHIYNPHTGGAALELASVTVAAPDLVTADIYATAAVAMGTERAAGWLAGRSDVLATLIETDGTVTDLPPRR